MNNPFAPGTGLRRYTRKHLRHDRDAARAEVLRLEGVINGLDWLVFERGERIDQLEADAVDVSVERQLRRLAEEKADDYERRYFALKARVDNEHAITVPPASPDPDPAPDDEHTAPNGIGVRTLREALNTAAV